MAREQKCPVGSRWQPSGSDRVFVVTERKPFGQLVIHEEGRAYFGDTKQRVLLASFSRLPVTKIEPVASSKM